MIRKIMHSILHLNASKGYVPYQDLESKQMLCGILDEPRLFADHIRRFTNSLTTQMVFGFRTVDINDENLHKLYDGMEKWSEMVASSTAAFLDVFPILRKLPDFMLPMRRYAQELHRQEKALYVGHWMATKQQILQGTAKVSLAKFLSVPMGCRNLTSASLVSASVLPRAKRTMVSPTTWQDIFVDRFMKPGQIP